jgi:quercetin dioxygenase-like cupin family protein
MHRKSIIIVGLAISVGLAGCGKKQETAIEDIVATHADQAHLVFENDFVKAVRFELEPGQELPLHKGGPRIVYALSDYMISWTEGEQTSEKQWATGDAHWHGAVDHAVKNIGDTEADYLVVSRKETILPEAGDYDIMQDAGRMDSAHSNVVFENQHVRLIEVTLAAGESQPLHHGIHRLIYPLTSYSIEYVSDQLDTLETTMEPGVAHWHAADRHSVENIGETTAEYLILEFKR